MPYAQYKDPNKRTIYVDATTEIKNKLLDICYSLNANEKDTLPHVIEDYYERHGIKPRPESSSRWKKK